MKDDELREDEVVCALLGTVILSVDSSRTKWLADVDGDGNDDGDYGCSGSSSEIFAQKHKNGTTPALD